MVVSFRDAMLNGFGTSGRPNVQSSSILTATFSRALTWIILPDNLSQVQMLEAI